MRKARMELLRKELLGPELEMINKRMDRKLEMSNEEIKAHLNKVTQKIDYTLKDRVSMIDEVIDQLEKLQKTVKINQAYL